MTGNIMMVLCETQNWWQYCPYCCWFKGDSDALNLLSLTVDTMSVQLE